MRPDEPRERSSSRRIAHPRTPPGPLQELHELIYQLYVSAGPPTLDDIAQRIADDSDLPGAPARDAIARIIGHPELPANQLDVVSVAAVLTRAAGWDSSEVAARVRHLWVEAALTEPVGRPLQKVIDPLELEVHRAIEAPDARDLPVLPPYIERDHDRELRVRIDAAVGGRSAIAVLVGGSSTGKTRACWEAIHAHEAGKNLLAGWRVWHPFDPTRPDAILDGLDRLASRTVVWLNEAQLYLLTEGSDLGERVAARLCTVLRDPDRAPLLVVGTMWPEYWAILTRRVDAEMPDPHVQARELLTGTRISVAKSFDPTALRQLKEASGQDPRLVEAATHAPDGQITQYLAGAPVLLDRYETAPPAARALLHAAMDLRRLGHGPALPLPLLEACAPCYVSDRDWDDLDDDWFSSALAYTEQRCHGAHRPLTPIRPRPGHSPPAQPVYRLADYLEQVGRYRRHREIIPAAVWPELAIHVANPADSAALGAAAADRRLNRHAFELLRQSAIAGHNDATYRLANLLAERGDISEAITVLRDLAAIGNEYATTRLARLLVEQGDISGATAAMRGLAPTGNNYAADLLAELLGEQADIPALRDLAAGGSNNASGQLAELFARRRDVLALRGLADTGNTHAAYCLARLLAEQGDIPGAATVMRGLAATGGKYAANRLTDLLVEHGDIPGVRDLASAGHTYAADKLAILFAEQRDIPALRDLASIGNTTAADRLAAIFAQERDIPALRDVAGTSNTYAADLLADLLIERRDIPALRVLAATGNANAADLLAVMLSEQEHVPGATTVLRGLAASGNEYAADRLAILLGELGDVPALRDLVSTGNEYAADRLAELLAEQGDVSGATAALRGLASVGNEYAANRLADLLGELGDVPALRDLASTGNEHATRRLADLLGELGDVPALRGLASVGNEHAANRLAELLADLGDVPALRDLASVGNEYAADRLAELLGELGDVPALRDLASTGNEHATRRLADLLAKQGDMDGLRSEVLRGSASAAAGLRQVLDSRADGSADRFRRLGLNADGTFA